METSILLYHAIDSESSSVDVDNAADLSVVVGKQCFEQQLQCMAQLGKQVVSLETVLQSDAAPAANADRVVITFDDGHVSNWSIAMPALKDAGMVATFYIVAGFVDKKPDYVTTTQLREMAAEGMLIGSHGMTHRWLPELSPEEIHRELSDSKSLLEDILQEPILDFALPGGHSCRAVGDAVDACNYRSVATSKPGVFRAGDNSLRLPRLEIRRGMPLEQFPRVFHRGAVRRRQMFEAAKASLRNTCGLSRYMKLRRFAHRVLNFNRS